MTPAAAADKARPQNGQRRRPLQRTCVAAILDLHASEVPHFATIQTQRAPMMVGGKASSVGLLIAG